MPAIKTLLFGVGINSVMIFAGLGGDVLKKGRKQSKKELAAWFLRTLIVLYAAAVVFGGAANLFRPYMNLPECFTQYLQSDTLHLRECGSLYRA